MWPRNLNSCTNRPAEEATDFGASIHDWKDQKRFAHIKFQSLPWVVSTALDVPFATETFFHVGPIYLITDCSSYCANPVISRGGFCQTPKAASKGGKPLVIPEVWEAIVRGIWRHVCRRQRRAFKCGHCLMDRRKSIPPLTSWIHEKVKRHLPLRRPSDSSVSFHFACLSLLLDDAPTWAGDLLISSSLFIFRNLLLFSAYWLNLSKRKHNSTNHLAMFVRLCVCVVALCPTVMPVSVRRTLFGLVHKLASHYKLAPVIESQIKRAGSSTKFTG